MFVSGLEEEALWIQVLGWTQNSGKRKALGWMLIPAPISRIKFACS